MLLSELVCCVSHTTLTMQAMPNTSSAERRAVILGWTASATRWAPSQAAAQGGALLSPEYAERLVATGRMTPLLRALSGAPM